MPDIDCLGYRLELEVEMGGGVVKGIYKQGVVEPLEPFSGWEGAEVFVLFPEPVPKPRGHSIWQQIKKEMAKEMPDLEQQTTAEKRREFDRLSQLIAERLPYNSPEEMEKAMRGIQENPVHTVHPKVGSHGRPNRASV